MLDAGGAEGPAVAVGAPATMIGIGVSDGVGDGDGEPDGVGGFVPPP